MTTPDMARFSRAGAAYVNSRGFRVHTWERQREIRTALQEARTWADLSDEMRTLMEEAGYGPGWQPK